MRTSRALFVIGLTFAAALPARDTPLLSNGTLHFEGFMASSGGTYFIVSLKKGDGDLSARAWLTIGQTFAGHVLSRFDPKNEILSVTNSSGRVFGLRLVDAKVVESNARAPEDPLARAMLVLEEARRGMRKQWDVPIEFRFDLDGSTMPVDVRERFLAQRQKEEERGGYLIGVFVGGSWLFSPYRGQASKVIPASLSDADRRRVEADWAILHAEGMARGTAYENRKKNGPLKE